MKQGKRKQRNTSKPVGTTSENALRRPCSQKQIPAGPATRSYPLEGRLAKAKSGWPMVTVDDCPPFPARNLSGIPTRQLLDPQNIGRIVMLSAFSNNPDEPVITGVEGSLLEDVLATGTQIEGGTFSLKASLDGKVVVLNAEHTIALQCGDACITLHSDGEIEISGTNLLIEAQGLNRIKGGALRLN